MDLESISQAFKTTINQKVVEHYFIQNIKGTKVGICNYGARITHFIILDSEYQAIDIVLGFNDIESYVNANEHYHGATVGPFANRIAYSKFKLGEKEFELNSNDGLNTLHSSTAGFHNKVWKVINISTNEICLQIAHKNLSGGFPGNIVCSITFTLTDDDELVMKYHAKSNQNTVINLTNHAYFNLNGEGNSDVLAHVVKINANSFVEINQKSIPTGKLKKVDLTPFDFRAFKSIGNDIEVDDEQLKNGNGYDHSFELNETNNQLNFAAAAIGDKSKIKLEVYTTEPAMQFYTGNFLNGKDKGKSSNFYGRRTAFCFETQHHPDSPNQPQFPSTFLAKGQEFISTSIYKVSII